MRKLELLNEFERISDELLAMNSSGSIDEVLEKIEVKLNQRNEIIEKINKLNENVTLSDEDLNRLYQKDLQLKTMFEEINLRISNSIDDVKNEKSLSSKKKKAHRGYLNPIRQEDGYFIDKKK